MAFTMKITDPTDPTTELDAYVRLVLNNRPRSGLGLGLHAEFLGYRSKMAADAGGQPLINYKMDIAAETYARLWASLFSASALDPAGINPDAVVYWYALKYEPQFAAAAAILEEGQAAIDFSALMPEPEGE